MIAIIGESGCGKSTMVDEFLKKNKLYKKIIPYTTRPIRQNEIDGREYHFITKEKFDELESNGFFVETSCYREWWYGLSKEDCKNAFKHTLVITTPAGVRMMKANNIDVIAVYLYVDRASRMINLIRRGDNVDEAYRRNLSDVGQFDGVVEEVNYVIDNTEYHMNVEQVVHVFEEVIKDINKRG